jgi:lipoprotein-anchoring transpeptidase ErfK/SrfK
VRRYQKTPILGLIALVILTWSLVIGSLIRVVLSTAEREVAGLDRPAKRNIIPEALAILTPYPTNIPISPPKRVAAAGFGALPLQTQPDTASDTITLPTATANPSPTNSPTPTFTFTPLPPTATPTATSEPLAIVPTISTPERFLLVHQDAQMMYVYESSVLVRIIPASTGRPVTNAFTPPWQGIVGEDWGSGSFLDTDLFSDYMWYLFPGPEGSILIHSVPYILSDGQKIYNRLDALGLEPSSRGCIRISPEDAAWLKAWGPVDVPIRITRWSGKISPVNN